MLNFATSKAGRDKGRMFIIIHRIDDEYVLIADGRLRKVTSPKKKKLKHLQVYDRTDENVEKLAENGALTNKIVWKAICDAKREYDF